MPRGVSTELVKHSLVARSWEAISGAAGGNGRLSLKEQRTLPADYKRAAEYAREGQSGLTAFEAISNYRRYVERVLAAVDTKGKGQLSLAEANTIVDPLLKSKVLDIRMNLLHPTDPFRP